MTACPNMIGSDTFIIVALRCSDSSTPAALRVVDLPARRTSAARAGSSPCGDDVAGGDLDAVLEDGGRARPRRSARCAALPASAMTADCSLP